MKLNTSDLDLIVELRSLPKRLRALYWGLEYQAWTHLTGARQQAGAKYLSYLAAQLDLSAADIRRYAKV